MLVERAVHDDRIGWVLIVRDEKGRERAQVRVSPAGRKWIVTYRNAKLSRAALSEGGGA
jgi:hypothetical protein